MFVLRKTLCCGAGIGYIHPPFSLKQANIPDVQKYMHEYMKHLADRGYLKQFFNTEIWGLNKPDGKIDFCFCEINPRCAHAYHIPSPFLCMSLLP